MDTRPIPAFYCCYLLRSTVRHASIYIGSTPNPVRRLRQHNGLSNGGAAKTSRDTLRPWEMACIVTGFPSNIAALQFEWAWQNTHLTRRIADEQRITIRETKVRISPKTGRARRRPARPRMSLTDKLSNLHLLLRVPSFSRWPLEVRFFCEDVYRVWQRWGEQVDGMIRGRIKVSLDVEEPADGTGWEVLSYDQAKSKRKRDVGGKGGLESIDVAYRGLKEHLEKSLFLLAEGEVTSCAVCNKRVDQNTGMVVVCPVHNCRAASHMTCLSSRFLAKNGLTEALIPAEGLCPTCKTQIRWVDLMREMTLRMRGEKEMERLLKKRRERKAKAATGKQAPSISVADHEDDVEAEEDLQADEEEAAGGLRAADVADASLSDDGWQYRMDEDDDIMSVISADTDTSRAFPADSPCKLRLQSARSETIIEETDWDDAEVLC
ncbi:MAG: Slx4p interacting protein [Pleopsidium flavum]|nr:MAG: Slx4p interacting protein [Pleopsidium flavum]